LSGDNLNLVGNSLKEKTMVWKIPKIEHLKPTIYGWTVSCPEGFLLETETDLGCYCYINARHGVAIKKGAKLGSHCSVYSEDTIGSNSGPVVIKEGAKIGTHTTILPNTVIGKSCCIGAYSLIKSGVILGDGIILPAYSFVKESILSPEDLDKFLMKHSKPPFNFGGLL
jgi:serine acetyltransferase